MKLPTRYYEDDHIRVSFEPGRCIHSAHCAAALPHVFDPNMRPWIQPQHATADEVARAVEGCPTGALHFERRDGGTEEAPDGENSITPIPDGPLYVRGDLELRDGTDQPTLRERRLALCRCGGSRKKPLCDGTHRKIAFQDDGVLAKREETAASPSEGRLIIKGAPDGPFVVQGGYRLAPHIGRASVTSPRGSLCRCGQSADKPFCDGAHVAAGFRSRDEAAEAEAG